MNHGLNLKPDGALDFLSLGALIHRLDPGVIPFHKASACDIHVSGGEFNVAANLSDCFRLKTGLASAMVDYPIGHLVAERVRAMGVTPFYKHFEHDGFSGPNLATVYSDRGQGMRPPVVFYNRANEAAAQLKPGDFAWSKLFGAGVRWFHSGGIFASLSPSTAELIIEAMKAGKAAGAVVSFDLNYRPKLWNNSGGRTQAIKVFNRIVEHVDVLFGGVEMLLGEEDAKEHPDNIAFDANSYSARVTRLLKLHPQIKIVTTTLRKVHSANRHNWSAVAWCDRQLSLAPTCELDVLDRVGTGDAYAAGFIYGLLAGEKISDAVKLGWAHGALVATTPGDTTMSTLAQVRAFAEGGQAEIQR